MPSVSTLPVYIAAVLVLLVVPGPSVLYITARGAAQGRRAGIVSVLGVHTGSMLHVLAAVAGTSALVVASATAFTVVKLVGGIYLIWLGARAFVRRDTLGGSTPPAVRPLRRLYADGVLVNLLNPKVALFFLAFLPQFVDGRRGPIWSQTLVLGSLYIVLGVMSDGVYALGGAQIGTWLRRRPRFQRSGRYMEGTVLVGLGLLTLVTPQRRVRSPSH